MEGEPKLGRCPALPDKSPGESAPLRLFPASDPSAQSVRRARPLPLAAPFVIAALLSLVLLEGTLARTLIPLGFALAAVLVAVRVRRNEQEHAQTPQRGLLLAEDRLSFMGGDQETPLLSTHANFGLTLLAPPKRDRIIALFSSALGTFYAGAHLDAASRRLFGAHLDRLVTVNPEEAVLDAVGPDGEPLFLSPADLLALIEALTRENATCLDRFVLTDARGAKITLDGRTLYVGERLIDLSAVLEWRSILFQENLGQTIGLYQGTWIRQGNTEIVFIALVPFLGPIFGVDLDLEASDRGVLRDLRLMQGTPAEPPPSEQRVAVDRLLMLPIRAALERSPLPTKRSSHANA